MTLNIWNQGIIRTLSRLMISLASCDSRTKVSQSCLTWKRKFWQKKSIWMLNFRNSTTPSAKSLKQQENCRWSLTPCKDIAITNRFQKWSFSQIIIDSKRVFLSSNFIRTYLTSWLNKDISTIRITLSEKSNWNDLHVF